MSPSYTISVSRKLFWRVVLPIAVAVVVVGGVTGVLVVDRLVMPNVVGVNKGIIEVPDVVGMDYEDARQKMYDVGLVCRVKEEEYSDSVVEKTVTRQFSAAGSKIKRGRSVDVAVSAGPEVAKVPALRGLAEHIARLELRKKGFRQARSHKAYHDKMPEGHVIRVEPPEGASISREMYVSLIVSQGPKPTHANMANVVGESLGDARAAIADAGLRVGLVDYRDNPSLRPGTVLSQSVPPGTSVPLDSKVDLVVSLVRN